MKHGTQELEFLVRIAQTITVGEVELLTVYFRCKRFAMHNDTALFSQIVSAPNVMVSCEEVYFHSYIRQFGQFAQETGIAFRHNGLEFIPKVEHIAQQIHGRSFVLDTVEEVDEASFLCAPVFDGT